jgi:aminopeptidase N
LLIPPPAPTHQIKHFEHAWLKESWATYMECCWLEHAEGTDAFLYQVRTT